MHSKHSPGLFWSPAHLRPRPLLPPVLRYHTAPPCRTTMLVLLVPCHPHPALLPAPGRVLWHIRGLITRQSRTNSRLRSVGIRCRHNFFKPPLRSPSTPHPTRLRGMSRGHHHTVSIPLTRCTTSRRRVPTRPGSPCLPQPHPATPRSLPPRTRSDHRTTMRTGF